MLGWHLNVSWPPLERRVCRFTFWVCVGMLTRRATSLWYLYATVVYFTLCKLLSRWKLPVLGLLALANIAITLPAAAVVGNEQRGTQYDLLQPWRGMAQS